MIREYSMKKIVIICNFQKPRKTNLGEKSTTQNNPTYIHKQPYIIYIHKTTLYT